MNCLEVRELVYGNSEDMVQLSDRIQIAVHIFFCRRCAQRIVQLKQAEEIMREDFLPSPPNLEESVMARIYEEELQETRQNMVRGGFSTRLWVIAGIVMLVSLSTFFFGANFKIIASETGTSFLLPVGITIGIVLSVYGAFFIASHLKEFSQRFGL